MDVVEILKEARDAVATADVPQDLRTIAFSKAIDLLSQAGENAPGAGLSTSVRHSVGSVAMKLGLDPVALENIYDVTDEGVILVLPRSKLPDQKGPAMKLVALLLAAARQSGGFDEGWTATEIVRRQCADYGVFDGNHFAESVAEMHDAFVQRGKGLRRELRVTQKGYALASQEIRRLLGTANDKEDAEALALIRRE